MLVINVNLNVSNSDELRGNNILEEKVMTASLKTFSEQQCQVVGFSTSKNYKTAVRSFLQFLNRDDIPIGDITEAMVDGYQHWLTSHNISFNTVSCYIRSIRSLYMKVMKENTGVLKNPFHNAFTGLHNTEKRAITISDVRKLHELELPKDSPLALSRDVFLFCIYAMGMPFVDVANLKKSQISGHILTYMRKKTGQMVQVRLEPCMKSIISHYSSSNSEYVFPLISSAEESGINRQYLSCLRSYNMKLKELATLAHIDCRLTSYVSRHTWASMAYDMNVDLPIISKAMGHTNTGTTLIYIRGINDKKLQMANRKIIKEILSPPVSKKDEINEESI
jgi:integrase/recombinase XerD